MLCLCKRNLVNTRENAVWKLVPIAEQLNVIDANWIYKNKYDESGIVTNGVARTLG